MNTLANHGYIPRNGIASFEEITLGMMELTRGNMFINKVFIGGVSPLVPPLPFELDDPETGGLSKHGRLEGDASMTRADAFIGDNFGDDGAEGRNTVFNLAKLIAMKKQKYCNGPNGEPKGELLWLMRFPFDFAARRVNAAFGQASFILNSVLDCTTNQASRAIINSFFRNQTFPPNWFRAAKLVTSAINGATQAQLMAVVPVAPGRNNAQGVSVADPAPPPPWNSSSACAADFDLQGNIPNTIWNTTGIFKQNVELLTGIQFTAASANAGCNQQVFPFGPTGV
ncbi:hypothetical protein C8J57DRAFT_1385614 [Mycena rebaudengoi]|nr:hypothetical protein C8J57DRAFT_1385614 [Mycena rebaudengoi]